MTILNPEFKLVPNALHDALLTIPATKAAAATEMISTAGLTLSQAQVETAIDRIVTDLADQLILGTADYATLLARHQTAPPAAALREIEVSGKLMLLEHEKSLAEAIIAAATAEFIALSQAQKDAIPNIKAAGDEGVDALSALVSQIDDQIQQLNFQRNLGF
jgi:hypothetical protein